MSKADTGKLSSGSRKSAGPVAPDKAGAGGEFAMHEHIGKHLKIMFDEVANEPIPEKLRDLLDRLERQQAEAESPARPAAKSPEQG